MEKAGGLAIFDQPVKGMWFHHLNHVLYRPGLQHLQTRTSRYLKGLESHGLQFTAGRSDWPRSAQGSAQVEQEGIIAWLQVAGLINSDHFLTLICVTAEASDLLLHLGYLHKGYSRIDGTAPIAAVC